MTYRREMMAVVGKYVGERRARLVKHVPQR
jgi:hypothetical protein